MCPISVSPVLVNVLNWVYVKMKVPFGSFKFTSIFYVECLEQKPS